MNMPPEIWADQLEDDGMDTSLLRVLLLIQMSTTGCQHVSYEAAGGRQGRANGDGGDHEHGCGIYCGSIFYPSSWGDGSIYTNTITARALSPDTGDLNRGQYGDAN